VDRPAYAEGIHRSNDFGFDSVIGLPFSKVISWRVPPMRFDDIGHLEHQAARWCGRIFDHFPDSNAARAALTASSTSALSPSATNASTSSFVGLIVANVLPDFAGTHFPLMRSCLGLFTRYANVAWDFAPYAALSIDAIAAAIFHSSFGSRLPTEF
jgi:hypothetical protein